jgi:hypothetical protein
MRSARPRPIQDSAVPERRVAGQADLCPAVAAETERPQLAAGHGFEHAKADVVCVQLGQAQHAARDWRRAVHDREMTNPPHVVGA